MRHGLTGVDHAVVLVRDLDAAEAAWRRIGFAPTPRGRHTLGPMNHCMMFERDYLFIPYRNIAHFQRGSIGQVWNDVSLQVLHSMVLRKMQCKLKSLNETHYQSGNYPSVADSRQVTALR